MMENGRRLFELNKHRYNGSQMERISRAREAVVLKDARKRFDERKKAGAPVDDPPLLNEGWGEVTQLCAITDMAGCTFGSIMMPTLIPAVVQATQMFLNYYPYPAAPRNLLTIRLPWNIHVVAAAPPRPVSAEDLHGITRRPRRYIVGRLHIINCQPTIAAIFRRALASIVPEHVVRRITVHPIGSRDIFDQVAREHLPVQVGGQAPCDELIPPPPPPPS